jgi:TonB family protein
MQATRPRGAGVKPDPVGPALPLAGHASAVILVVSTRADFLLELGAVLADTAGMHPVESLSVALEQMGASRREHILVFDTRGMSDLRNCVGRAYARAPEAAILLFADAADEESMRQMFKSSKVFAVLPIPMDSARTALIFADALTDANARNAPAPMHIEVAPARSAPAPARTAPAPAPTTSVPANTAAAPARIVPELVATPAHVPPTSEPTNTAAAPGRIVPELVAIAAPVPTTAAPANTVAAPSVPTADGWGMGAAAALVVLACAWFIAADKHAILPGAAPAKPSAPVKQAPVDGSTDAEPGVAAKAAREVPPPASAPSLGVPQVASSPPSAEDHSPVLQSRLKLIHYAVPEYPAAERARHVGGTVTVAYTVDTHGATRHVRVISADPHGTFDRDAVNAVKLWRYAPVMVDNAAVAVPTRTTIRFTPP